MSAEPQGLQPGARSRRAVGAAALALLLVLTGCTATAPAPDRGTVVDLLEQDWGHVPGVDVDEAGLGVTSTGRSIVEQDGSGGQADPPVALMGTHLLTGGDVTISAAFDGVTADATLAVLDAPPVVADEFRLEPAGVRVTLRGDDLRVEVFDGSPPDDVTDPTPTDTEEVTLDDPAAEITVHRSEDRFEVASGGETVVSLARGDASDAGDASDPGEAWLGLSSEEGSFTVVSLTAAAPTGVELSTAGPAVLDAEADPDGLQALADRARPGFRVGAAVALGPLAADDDYATRVVGDFGALTPENAMKPQTLSPRQGEYRFEEADALLDLAEEKGLAVHGHTIAFTEAMPRWMRELPTGTDEERRASADALLAYVDTVVTHFRGRLASLDVVNEPFGVDQGTDLQQNVWYRVFGPGYPAVVSRAVHDADPDVRQFVNENGADVPGPRQEALLQLVTDANEQGGHLDGVGLQAHVYDLDTDAITADDLEATFAAVEAAGLVARISENDVPADEGQDVQAEQYATVLDGCLRSEACVSYTTWGVDDRYDVFVDDDGALQQGHDLLVDDAEPTPAHDALRRVLGG